MPADAPPPPPRRVYFAVCRPAAKAHELATQRDLAQRVAALLGWPYAGEIADPLGATPAPRDAYLVPNDTIASPALAQHLGIRDAGDLFGSVVPQPFVATKVITHPRIDPAAAAPMGWSDDFPARVRDVVLPGWSAFSRRDANEAGRRLLGDGPVRVKPAGGIGGSGQTIARHETELDAQLAALDAAGVLAQGVVLERNLDEVRTYSVGLLHVGSLHASYFGTQRNTRSRSGREVYGGSSITLLRGGFDALAASAVHGRDLACAVALARRYHEAALACFGGLIVSRANYDVVIGRDHDGHPHAGVLEQSWRIGGASGAEVAGMQRLRDEPARISVRASTVEHHGDAPHRLPPGAIVSFAGTDPEAGSLLKYTQIHDDDDDGDDRAGA